MNDTRTGGSWRAVSRLLAVPTFSRLISGAFRRFPSALPAPVKNRLPSHRVKIRLPGSGVRLRFESAGDEVTRGLFWSGFDGYERASLEVFFALLAEGPECVLDVGAYTGLYGFAAAALCPHARVYAFEPVPATFRRLQENAALNRLPNLSIHQAAVSDRPGKITMYTVPGLQLGITNSLVQGLNGAVEPVEVPAIALDSFVEAEGIGCVSLMKIDVESAEHLVLAGGTATLDRDRPVIICEVLFGQFSTELEPQLSKRDYRFFLITENGLQVKEHIEPDPLWGDLNFLLVPAEEVERLPEGLRAQIAGAPEA